MLFTVHVIQTNIIHYKVIVSKRLVSTVIPHLSEALPDFHASITEIIVFLAIINSFYSEILIECPQEDCILREVPMKV